MIVTANMGLTAWDQGSDEYDYSELATNFTKLDAHDHTSTKGLQIPSAGIQDNAITAAKIAAGAVGSSEIADDAVGSAEIATNAVGSAEIAAGAVGSAELADGAVTSVKLAEGAGGILGEVRMWWRKDSGTPLPGGDWEVCDGRAWSTVPNAWGYTTGNMPDLRNRFVLGAATTGNGTSPSQNPDIGQVGGDHQRNLSHSHTVASHTHSVPSHVHSILTDGSHSHSISGDGAHNHSIANRQNAFISGITVQDTSLVNQFNGNLGSLFYGGGALTNGESMPGVAAHNHGGATGAHGNHSHGGVTGYWGDTSGSSAPSTNAALNGVTDLRPYFIGLLHIMKVR